MKPFPETSNYQILIGDVELGPRPELLDVAVPLFTLTRALVTDEQQTVILMNTSLIILDWSTWVTDTLGDSADDASYTIRRTQLDVLGNPIRFPEEVQPTDLNSRIVVQLNPANNEYYIQISEAFVSAMGAEDPDRAIYELEGCVPQSDGSEQCYKSNITVYALGLVFGPLGKTFYCARPWHSWCCTMHWIRGLASRKVCMLDTLVWLGWIVLNVERNPSMRTPLK